MRKTASVENRNGYTSSGCIYISFLRMELLSVPVFVIWKKSVVMQSIDIASVARMSSLPSFLERGLVNQLVSDVAGEGCI